ncbi:MAG: DNA repair protein RadC [Acidobacteriota bacterium]
MRDLPGDERPRERLLRHGSSTLSEAELLAVLLRTGRRGVSALEMARQLLREHGGIGGLPGLAFGDLRRAGLGPAKAAALMAAVELGRRMARGRIRHRNVLSRPAAVANYLTLRYARGDQEVAGALFLDSRCGLLGEKELFRGALARVPMDPQQVLREALLHNAAAVVVFHTHPSGDPSPSVDDWSATRSLRAAAEAVGVKLVDHLIVGRGGRWVSLQEERSWS